MKHLSAFEPHGFVPRLPRNTVHYFVAKALVNYSTTLGRARTNISNVQSLHGFTALPKGEVESRRRSAYQYAF